MSSLKLLKQLEYILAVRPLIYFQSDYTRCCINTIVLLMMST